MPFPDDDEEKPLDPALERVQARIRRLMLLAGLTLGLGLMAVFAAIFYRIAILGATDAPPAAPVGTALEAAGEARLAVDLPPAARLLSSALDGDRLALTYADGEGTLVVVIDLGRMRVVRRLRLDPG